MRSIIRLSFVLLLGACGVFARVHLDTFEDDFNSYLDTGVQSVRLAESLDALRLRTPLKFRTKQLDAKIFDEENKGATKIDFSCVLCRTVVNTCLGWYNDGNTAEEIVQKAVNLCRSLNIQTETVCRGLAEANIDIVMYILGNKEVTAATACGFALFPDCPLEAPEYEWTIDLSSVGPKPPVIEPTPPEDGAPTFSVLHLPDIHVDPNYTPGGNAACEEPMCCRSDQGPPANESAAAGYWGDYRDCDLPLHSLADLLQQVSTNHPDLEYIIFTGDIIDHGVWATTKDYNTELFNSVMGQIREAFGDKLVVPVFGNHEPHPLNVYTNTQDQNIPSELSTSWLYELAADVWGSWIPGSRDTILRGGYYTVQVKPKLRLIVLNSNFCYNFNFWVLYDNEDPTGQLVWLAEQLQLAEWEEMKVHILGHIPSGSDSCLSTWSREYRRILDRFENTVVAQFHGHTHNDHFYVFYDLDDPSRANNVAYVGGSATSYSNLNPNYRIYTVDGDHDTSSYSVLDHETWSYNLTEANLGGADVPPVWKKLYSFREAYGVSTMFPKDMDMLVKKMAVDRPTLEQYFRYYVKEGDTSLEEGCDDECLDSLLCNIVTTVSGDSAKCEELVPARSLH